MPKVFGNEGFPRLALASKESIIPVWNHSFCFSLDAEKDYMFNDGNSAVVFEFYAYKKSKLTYFNLVDLIIFYEIY